MSKKHVFFASCLFLALAGCTPADVTSQSVAAAPTPANDAGPKQVTGKEFEKDTAALIQGAAKMQGVVVACNLASRAETDQAIADQRARYVSKGYGGGDFDRLHGVAFDDALKEMNGAGAQQKAQSCEQMKAFGEKMSQMGKEIQQRMQDQP